MDTKNNWLYQDSGEQVDFYLSESDLFLVERKRCLHLMRRLFEFRFPEQKGLKILDLGCGDGALTRLIAEKYPENEFFLLDGSPKMLDQARKNFSGQNYHFIEMTFEKYLSLPREDQKYDCVLSSMAIHHLDILEKKALYSKLFHEIRFGGLFLDYDVVLPVSTLSEEWQLEMWREWMNEMMVQAGKKAVIDKYVGLPDSYKAKPENKPSDLFDQVEILRKVGFRDAECYYKYGIFTLFGGIKD